MHRPMSNVAVLKAEPDDHLSPLGHQQPQHHQSYQVMYSIWLNLIIFISKPIGEVFRQEAAIVQQQQQPAAGRQFQSVSPLLVDQLLCSPNHNFFYLEPRQSYTALWNSNQKASLLYAGATQSTRRALQKSTISNTRRQISPSQIVEHWWEQNTSLVPESTCTRQVKQNFKFQKKKCLLFQTTAYNTAKNARITWVKCI